MIVRLNHNFRFQAFRVSDKLTLTKDWTKVTQKQGKSLVSSEFMGMPLVEVKDAPAVDETVEDSEIEVDTGSDEDAE